MSGHFHDRVSAGSTVVSTLNEPAVIPFNIPFVVRPSASNTVTLGVSTANTNEAVSVSQANSKTPRKWGRNWSLVIGRWSLIIGVSK